MRRGSTNISSQSSCKISVSSKSFSINHGNQLSMPSKLPPSANRSQCSRPHVSVATSERARSMTSSSSCNSRAAKITASLSESVERWSLTLNEVSLSTSSPHKSMRTGVLDVLGNMSIIEPRRAISPRCSTSSSRRYPPLTSCLSSSSASSSSPGRTMIGSKVVAFGPSFCNSALTEPTTTRGRSVPRMRHSTSIRRPMVSTLGLTRSNGSVSHAGNRRAFSAPRNCTRSSCNCCAPVPVGVATINVVLGARALNALMISARAFSATASTEFLPPISPSAGSCAAMSRRSESCIDVSRLLGVD